MPPIDRGPTGVKKHHGPTNSQRDEVPENHALIRSAQALGDATSILPVVSTLTVGVTRPLSPPTVIICPLSLPKKLHPFSVWLRL